MNLLAEYIKYHWNAKGRHGTHSPFVYDLIENCLRFNISANFKDERLQLYNSLKSSTDEINIVDFGAGSKRLKNTRKISQIFKTSSTKGKFGDLLYKLSSHYKPQQVLEFGTSLGIGAIHLGKGNPDAEIITVEACPETRALALENFEKMRCPNIQSELSTFSTFLENYSGKKFDLVFIDGHHDGAALKSYLIQLKKFTHNDTLFILDDIRWSDSMLQAWKEIVSSKDYHVTMDFFRMGIVIQREQQEKEHFWVKF